MDIACNDIFRENLKKKGGRFTAERKALLQLICNMSAHFRPEELRAALEKAGHSISLTTVYRNLSVLEEAGIIRRTDCQDAGRLGGVRYERIWGRPHHDHLLCSHCGTRVEFSYPAIDLLQEAVAKEHGFTLERHYLELVGVCGDCKPSEAGGQ